MADCPVLCQLKFQNDTALSNMKARVMAPVYSFRELIPIKDMIASLGDAQDLPKD